MRIPYPACPLCASKDFHALGEADCSRHPLYRTELPARMRWMQCRACTHVFTDGYWSKEAEALVFASSLENQRVGHDLEQQRQVSARMIEKVLPYRSAGRWLDVGFGNAALLFTAREFGFEPVGLDLRDENVNALGKSGIEAHRRDIAQFRPWEPFDVISMNDVLEHMPYPGEGLAAAVRLLNAGGVLLVSMPNFDSDIWKAMDAAAANPYWGELEHYHNFGRKRLYAFLREHGLEPARYGVSERYRAGMEVIALR